MPSLYPSSPARIVPRLLHGAVNRLRGLCLCRHLSGRDPPLAEAAAEKLAWTLLQQDVVAQDESDFQKSNAEGSVGLVEVPARRLLAGLICSPRDPAENY